jgi:hypothetical protein
VWGFVNRRSDARLRAWHAPRHRAVATDVGGNPEMIIDGQTGWLVMPGDERALAAKVLQVLLDSVVRHAMGEAAEEYLRREFTEKQIVARVAALYQQLPQAKGSPAPLDARPPWPPSPPVLALPSEGPLQAHPQFHLR